jgi:hypothetical protein
MKSRMKIFYRQWRQTEECEASLPQGAFGSGTEDRVLLCIASLRSSVPGLFIQEKFS